MYFLFKKYLLKYAVSDAATVLTYSGYVNATGSWS